MPNYNMFDIDSPTYRYDLSEYIFPSVASWITNEQERGHPITKITYNLISDEISITESNIEEYIKKIKLENKYSLKGIPRDINNPIRNYIINEYDK